MLIDRTTRTRTAVTCAWLALAACSSLPEHRYPDHVDHDFTADFVVADDGRLRFPSSSRAVVVRAIELSPTPLAERFVDDERWFVYPAGARVAVRGTLRAYARGDGSVPTLRELLPGARVAAPTPPPGP